MKGSVFLSLCSAVLLAGCQTVAPETGPVEPTGPSLVQQHDASLQSIAPALDIETAKQQALTSRYLDGVGTWRALENNSGTACTLVLSPTQKLDAKRGVFSAAAASNCSPALFAVDRWSVSKQQLLLQKADGTVIAHLYRTKDKRWDGQVGETQASLVLVR